MQENQKKRLQRSLPVKTLASLQIIWVHKVKNVPTEDAILKGEIKFDFLKLRREMFVIKTVLTV